MLHVRGPLLDMSPNRGVRLYAIVRSGGKQHKVSVGDALDVELLPGSPGRTVVLPAVLVVDGATVTSDPAALREIEVTAEITGERKGPKIRIIKHRAKTGYRKRQGHRQRYTRLTVTGIGSPGAPPAAGPSRAEVATGTDVGELTEVSDGAGSPDGPVDLGATAAVPAQAGHAAGPESHDAGGE